MHTLALERVHCLEPHRLAVLAYPLRGVLRDRDELLAATRPITTDIQEESRRRAGLAIDREPGQFLERLERRAPLTDQRLETITDDLDDRSAALDELIDITVVVEDVEQTLDIVGRDLALRE